MTDVAEKVEQPAKPGAKLFSLVERLPPARVNADIVEMLTDLLEQAKAGEISGIVVGILSPADEVSTCYCGLKLSMLSGLLNRVQYRIMEEWNDAPGVESDDAS